MSRAVNGMQKSFEFQDMVSANVHMPKRMSPENEKNYLIQLPHRIS